MNCLKPFKYVMWKFGIESYSKITKIIGMKEKIMSGSQNTFLMEN